jgi:hypothetical protein
MLHYLPAPHDGNAAYERTSAAKAVRKGSVPKSRM